jgi:phosphoethanolamine N-methyltransferase
MAHSDEYTEAMIAALDLVWGEGFMAPGGEGHVQRMVAGLNLKGARVLDIGCGQGRPACLLAAQYGAAVVGTDLESHLIQRARRRAEAEGVSDSIRFEVVAPGPLAFADESFDCVVISGALTQIEDKLGMYRECLRVLRPGGTLSCYDWMKPPGPFSPDMLYWFELEGLTYAMRTPDEHLELLAAAGFAAPRLEDKSAWYTARARDEYISLAGPLRPRLTALLGEANAAHFVENWRMLAQVCERGELLQFYTRAHKPIHTDD